jgi:hypothetical protein
MRLGIDIVLRCLIVAVVLFAGVGAVAACAGELYDSCEHPCCNGADRSRPLWRVTRILTSGLVASVSSLLPRPSLAVTVPAPMDGALAAGPISLSTASLLRI